MWTRKEALAKAMGAGIGAILRDDGAPREERGTWTLVDVGDLPGYAACVAAEGSGLQLVRQHVTAVTERR